MTVSPEFAKNTLAWVCLALLVWSVWAGAVAGRDLARARATVFRAGALQTGLSLFYQDQDRYPGELEYANGEKLAVYLENFPGNIFTHKKWCKDEPRYSSAGGGSFVYDFCLPRGFGGYERGWHSIDERSFPVLE